MLKNPGKSSFSGVLLLNPNQLADIWPLAGKHLVIKILLPVNVGNAICQFFDGNAVCFYTMNAQFKTIDWEV